jgi:hypothetical protein
MRCSSFRAPILTGVKRTVSARGLKPAGESLEGMAGGAEVENEVEDLQMKEKGEQQVFLEVSSTSQCIAIHRNFDRRRTCLLAPPSAMRGGQLKSHSWHRYPTQMSPCSWLLEG